MALGKEAFSEHKIAAVYWYGALVKEPLALSVADTLGLFCFLHLLDGDWAFPNPVEDFTTEMGSSAFVPLVIEHPCASL